QQQAVDREVAATERDISSTNVQTPQQPSLDHSEELRRRFLQLAAEVVQAEEQIAELHESAATRDPEKHARNLQIAQQAREAARHAQLAAEHLGTPPAEP
ncbi:MAG TPA: hypothetical protein VI452_07990, partial [Marmoricola sp.]